jgi:glycosyltransferase involved in cell wall biosynthesis
MRIVHMTSVHPWYDTRIFQRMCRSLADTGHEVHLVYAAEAGPNKETVDGVQLHRVNMHTGRVKRITMTSRAVYHRARHIKADIYHFHDPELMPWAILIKRKGFPVCYDVHENYPAAMLSKHYLPSFVRPVVSFSVKQLQKLLMKYFDAVVGAWEGTVDEVPSFKVDIIHNYPILDLRGQQKSQEYSHRDNVVLYSGNISIVRGIKELLRAIGEVASKIQVNLILCGNFSPPSIQKDFESNVDWRFVSFLGWVDSKKLSECRNVSRVGVVTFYPEPNHLRAQPNKMFEYMSACLPVVASNFPLWKQIIETERCGLVVDPLNPQEIADAIQWLLEHPEEAEKMGENGRRAILQKYNWDGEFVKLLELYKKIVY